MLTQDYRYLAKDLGLEPRILISYFSALKKNGFCRIPFFNQENNAKATRMTKGYPMETGSPVGKDGWPGHHHARAHNWWWMHLKWPRADNTPELKNRRSAKPRRRSSTAIHTSNIRASGAEWSATLHDGLCIKQHAYRVPTHHTNSDSVCNSSSSVGQERQEINALYERQRKVTVNVPVPRARM